MNETLKHKKKAFKKILLVLGLLIAIFLIAPRSSKPFEELSSFNQYKPCKEKFDIANEFSKSYNMNEILIVEFQVSFIIFGFEQDYYLENGLDCRFQKRYSFEEAIEEGKILTFLSRRLASISSYIIFILIILYLIKQFKIIISSKEEIDEIDT